PEAITHSQLLLIGPASYHQQTVESLMTETLPLIFKNENVSFDIVMNMQNHACVNVILESQSEISPFLPGKFPHCVMADKPIISLTPFNSETRRLLGNDYPYWSEQTDETKIADILEQLYLLWKNDRTALTLNRPDLVTYLSPAYLKNVIDTL
ncbi:MAG: UDP-glycosyltransferase, partial [Bacteroidota bacterium]